MTIVTITQTLEDAIDRINFLKDALEEATTNSERWKESEDMKRYYPAEYAKAVMLQKWLDDMYGKNTESM